MLGEITIRDVYLAGHLFSLLLEVAVGYVIGYRSEMRARRLFLATVAVILCSTLLTIAAILTPTPALHRLIWRLWTVGALTSALVAFLFVSEFSGRPWRDSRAARVLGAWWLALTLTVLTEPYHDLYWSSTALVTAPFPHLSVTTGPARLAGIAFTLVVTALTLYYLLNLSFMSRHSSESALLILAGGLGLSVVPFFASVVSSLFIPTYNHLSFGYAIVAVTFGLTAARLDFAAIVPVARDIAIENLPDPYIAIDDAGRLVDFNAALATLFETVDASAIGAPVASVVPDLVAQGFAADDSAPDGRVFTIVREGRERYFESRSSALYGPRDEAQGTEYVLRDITPIREREAELSLLTDVFSRTFRHNIRNELIVVQGNTEAARDAVDDEQVIEYLDRVSASADRLLSHTENARAIEAIVDSDSELAATDLRTVIDRVVTAFEGHPDVTFETDVDSVSVLVTRGFQQAVESAVENAIQHNPSPVRVSLTSAVSETVSLRIEDDGVGISAHEQRVIDESVEHPLEHGAGVGLWLMKWFVTKSGGNLAVENTGSGTRVTMTLRRPD